MEHMNLQVYQVYNKLQYIYMYIMIIYNLGTYGSQPMLTANMFAHMGSYFMHKILNSV